jgi:acyl-CoA synthetase (NDP forming)
VIRVDNIHQLFDVAQLVVHQPLPTGPRVAVVTNSDALGALAADACASWGLEVVHGPVAVRSEASAEEFRAALTEAFAAPDVDSVVAGFIPPLVTIDADVAVALAEVAAEADKTCVATFLGMHGVTEALSASSRAVPAYPTPEDSVRALVSATRYAQWRGRDRGARVAPKDLQRERARELVERLTPREHEDVELSAEQCAELLAAYGVEVWPAYPVQTPDEAAAAAERAGYPVALKATAPLLRHRADLGAVRLGIEREAELRTDLKEMQRLLERHGPGEFVVQAMAPVGVACVVRSVEDPLFGPIISFGLSGDASDLLGDVAYGVPPLTDVDVAELVRSARAAPRLFGYRGLPALDVGALEELIARVAVLADDLPELRSLELNPVVVSERGAVVLGARASVARADRADATRRLSST